MELDGAVRFEVGFQQSPVRFQDGDGSATIIVGTWGTEVSNLETQTCMKRPLPGAGRNGHKLVLVGRVSTTRYLGNSEVRTCPDELK